MTGMDTEAVRRENAAVGPGKRGGQFAKRGGQTGRRSMRESKRSMKRYHVVHAQNKTLNVRKKASLPKLKKVLLGVGLGLARYGIIRT